jgi:hypothetical protein
MNTTTVRTWGTTAQAYAQRLGNGIVVRVYDATAGHYTVCHSLTPGQIRRVIALTLPPDPAPATIAEILASSNI